MLHTDAVQAFAWLDVAAVCAARDLVSISAHKFGGPKGVGVLVVREGVALEPLLLGGGQERGRRSGTQNVAGIVAMAAAMSLAHDERKAMVDRVGALRDRLVDGLASQIGGAHRDRCRATARSPATRTSSSTASRPRRCCSCSTATGVCASAASSCSSGAMEPSHVLAAMGVLAERALGALRLSLGPASTSSRRRSRARGHPRRGHAAPRGSAVQVLVAMSGGVDSSVAAALLLEAGHEVVGVTMKLWGGESDTGCCSVADVDDARRVAQQLGIDHHVFNFGDDFDARRRRAVRRRPRRGAARRTRASSATGT